MKNGDQKIRILHLEDVPTDAEQVKWMLRDAGLNCEVRVVETKARYREALQEFHPDIIISDHNLPAFSSMEALGMLKQSELLIPFILLTGAVSEEFAVMALQQGAEDYLLKDRPQRLPAAILKVVDKYRHIREQKKAEEENRRLALIASLTVNAVVVTDPAGRITWVNKGFARMTEYSFSEACNRKPGELLHGPETDQETVSHMRACTLSCRGFKVEVLNYTKSKRKYWVDIEAMPMFDTRETLTGFMAIEQDITERKNAEHEKQVLIDRLLSYHQNLEQTVVERTKTLDEALGKEKQLVEMKTRFVSIASHEFRTPLATISISCGMIRKHRERLSAEEIDLSIQNIEKQVVHMTRLLDDILEMERSGKLILQGREIILNDFLSDLCKEVGLSKGNTHQVRLSAEGGRCTIMSDENLLRGIFINLLTNAIKFSPEAAHVDVTLSRNGDRACVTVKDHGIGIPAEDMGHLFEPFFRARNASAIQGTGLGLSIIRKSVGLLNGTISVKSEPGKGTEMIVDLPVRLT